MLDVLCVLFLLETNGRPRDFGYFPDFVGRFHYSLLPLPAGPRVPPERVRDLDYRRDPAEYVYNGGDASSEMAGYARRRPHGSRKARLAGSDQRTPALRERPRHEDSQNDVVYGLVRIKHVPWRVLHLEFGQPLLQRDSTMAQDRGTSVGYFPRGSWLVVRYFRFLLDVKLLMSIGTS